jgi:hypothetical protein
MFENYLLQSLLFLIINSGVLSKKNLLILCLTIDVYRTYPQTQFTPQNLAKVTLKSGRIVTIEYLLSLTVGKVHSTICYQYLMIIL